MSPRTIDTLADDHHAVRQMFVPDRLRCPNAEWSVPILRSETNYCPVCGTELDP